MGSKTELVYNIGMNNNDTKLTNFFNEVYHGPTFFNRSFRHGKDLPIDVKFVQYLVGEEVLCDEVIEKYNSDNFDEKTFAKKQIVSILRLHLNTYYRPGTMGTMVALYRNWLRNNH